VINDLDDMHDRYRELWVEMELEDINVPLLQSTFNRTYHQLDSSPKPQQIARLSKMVQQLEKILSKKTGRKNSESASMSIRRAICRFKTFMRPQHSGRICRSVPNCKA
jgi:hypothetical protein